MTFRTRAPRTFRPLPAAALCLLLTSASAFAQKQTLTVDPAASQVAMTLKTNHDIVNGNFHVQSGTIDFNRSAATIGGSVIVAAGSGDTGNGSRDKKMNKDILVVDKYTTVTFAPKSYSGTLAPSGDSTLQVAGVFTLLGTPHDITVPMQVHIDGTSCTAKGHLVIPYVQWGLKDPSFMVWKAEKEVNVDLTLVGHLAP